jgi:hypothetical protein
MLEGLSALILPAQLLEELSPHPDIHHLFEHYNALYFDGALGACSVEFSSSRMTMYRPLTTRCPLEVQTLNPLCLQSSQMSSFEKSDPVYLMFAAKS